RHASTPLFPYTTLFRSRFTYFHDLFGRLTLNPGVTITVLRRDRTIIMRTPFDLDVIGKNLAERPSWRADNLKEGTAYAGVGPVRSEEHTSELQSQSNLV